eukprot:TRINITY_DN24084_c0_g1_i2.p1 TRINITY_DN24084_c0_g1~~TRINITY_DN24084_c0_g1_i2.p1  ORF type:complete len:686 (+),score=125.74 TRINITY_DN24084_c0_g1_i2:163-2220(+)
MVDEQTFLAAAANGSADVVREGLQGIHRRTLIAAQDSHGRGAVHLAARSGRCQMVCLLHDFGVNLEDLDGQGQTPLHLACEHGRLEVALALLELSGAPFAEDVSGRSALHMAACCRESRVCGLILSRYPELLSRPDKEGRTPLFYAVLNPRQAVGEQCARLLLDSFADPNVPDCFGLAPLHYAAEAGLHGTVSMLLLKEADPSLVDSIHGRTPVERASSQAIRDILCEAIARKSSVPERSSSPQNTSRDGMKCFEIDKDVHSYGILGHQSRFTQIMEQVQWASLQQGLHLSQPQVFDGSWMADVCSHEQLLGEVLRKVSGPEACIRVFNLLRPPQNLPIGTGDEKDIQVYFGSLHSPSDADEMSSIGATCEAKQMKEHYHLRSESSQNQEALEAARTQLQEIQRCEHRLQCELQAALQDAAPGSEKAGAEREARGVDAGPNTLAQRMLRSARQLAQQGEELRLAEASARKLARDNAWLEEQFDSKKIQCTEFQAEHIELHKRLEKELLYRGEQNSWKLVAEQGSQNAEVVRDLLGRRLEEAEVAETRASQTAQRCEEETEVCRRDEGRISSQLRQELQESRGQIHRLETAAEQAQSQALHAEEVRRLQFDAEVRDAKRCREEMQNMLRDRERSYAAQLLLEAELQQARQAKEHSDEQWEKILRFAPDVGHAFVMSMPETADEVPS